MSTPRTNSPTEQPEKPPSKPTLTFWQTLTSVLYAMIGVQSRKNAQISLEKGHIGLFIAVGLLVVGGFILTVSLVVYFAISSS